MCHRQFNPAKTVYSCLQYNFEEGGSTNEPELFMMVRREIAQSRCETARGAARPRCVLEQYVEGVSGEPARRRLVAAANPRLEQKRS